MTSRHTITHADELYVGNAFNEGYSPDGRRGIKMTHLYAHEFLSTADAVPLTATDIALLSSFNTPSLFSPSTATSYNFLSLCSGTRITAGATIFNLDVPRNITWSASGNDCTIAVLNIYGKDAYGQDMVEAIQGGVCSIEVSGVKAFKSIHKLAFVGATKAYTDHIVPAATVLQMGVGVRMGLPFHLADKGKFIGMSVDGHYGVSDIDATDAYNIHIGLDNTTDSDSAVGATALDVRGTIEMVSPAVPDASTRFTALMIVDHSTDRKAFGAPQATLCTDNY